MNPANNSTESLKSIADEAIDTAEEKTHDAMESARKAAGKAADKVGDLEQDINESVVNLTNAVTRYIHEEPVKAAGIAFAAGILTTMLLRRR